MTTFYRLLKDTDKASALRTAVTAHRSGDTDVDRAFTVDPKAFSKVPNTPFAYWVDDEIRNLFVKLPPFESEGRTVKQGLATADDFRFVRAWWEVDPARRLDPGLGGAPDWREDLERFQVWCRRRTHEGKGWAPFAKGGEYSPYYSDIHLVVNWEREGEEIKNFVDPRTGKQNSRPQNTDYYFRPGIFQTLRAAILAPHVTPAGCVFGHNGFQAFGANMRLYDYLGWLNSTAGRVLYQIQVGRHGFSLFIAGVLQNSPVPDTSVLHRETSVDVPEVAKLLRNLKATADSSPWFSIGFQQKELNFTKYEESLNGLIYVSLANHAKVSSDQIQNMFEETARRLDFEGRSSIVNERKPGSIDFAGLVFARWDLRFSLNPDLVPALPDPFDPLPVVPPATLVGPDGLPATAGKIVSEEWLQARPNAITLPPAGTVANPIITDDEYPIPIPWDGILVDDPEHPSDIVARIRQVLAVLHGEGAQQAEEELCTELGVDTLRDYLANPKGFFADHLSRYSKSRRKAPIYWPLSTPSGGWTAWIYYPRMTDLTIYTLIERYLHPRLELARQLYEEVAAIPAASRSPSQQRQFDISSRDKDELAAMEEELKRIAAMPYRANHDDGVPILAAPFAAMFRHREWAKYLNGIWDKLEAGEYDWAHLAYAIWPERVKEKARQDRSIAIAHGLEEAQ